MKELYCDTNFLGGDHTHYEDLAPVVSVGLRKEDVSALYEALDEAGKAGAFRVEGVNPVIERRFGQMLLASPVLRELFGNLWSDLEYEGCLERKYDVSGRFTVTYDVEAEGVLATSEEHAMDLVREHAHLDGYVDSPVVSLGGEGALDGTYVCDQSGGGSGDIEIAAVTLSD